LVQPLHHDHHRTDLLVVQAAAHRVIEPGIGTSALRLGQRLVGLERIINDEVTLQVDGTGILEPEKPVRTSG
jgi:hypothetical protein